MRRRILALSLVLGIGSIPGLAQAQIGEETTTTTVPYTEYGVSSEMIETNTQMTINRMYPLENGGTMLRHNTGFEPDEVLTINESNEPELMTRGADNMLTPHPTHRVGVLKGDLFIVESGVDMPDLADNLYPTVTYEETVTKVSPFSEIPVAYETSSSRPLSAIDFSAELPDVLPPVSTIVTPTGEREVALPTGYLVVLPPGWRQVTVGDKMLILDEQGVIQHIQPVSQVGM